MELSDLEALVGALGWGYIVTTGSERPQVVAFSIVWHDGDLLVQGVGQGTLANITKRPRVSVVWPPAAKPPAGAPAGHTLIVDGDAAIAQRAKHTSIRIRPTGAVWHRPAPPAD